MATVKSCQFANWLPLLTAKNPFTNLERFSWYEFRDHATYRHTDLWHRYSMNWWMLHLTYGEKPWFYLFFSRVDNTVSLYKKIVAEWPNGGRNIIYNLQHSKSKTFKMWYHLLRSQQKTIYAYNITTRGGYHYSLLLYLQHARCKVQLQSLELLLTLLIKKHSQEGWTTSQLHDQRNKLI